MLLTRSGGDRGSLRTKTLGIGGIVLEDNICSSRQVDRGIFERLQHLILT